MLDQISFVNYRGFSEHTLPLKSETIIVGRNNAGKSTVIEGFRLASVVTQRYKNLTFKQPPDWLASVRHSLSRDDLENPFIWGLFLRRRKGLLALTRCGRLISAKAPPWAYLSGTSSSETVSGAI
jgi:hypothetical protein